MSGHTWSLSVQTATNLTTEPRATASYVVERMLAVLDDLPRAEGSYVTVTIMQTKGSAEE